MSVLPLSLSSHQLEAQDHKQLLLTARRLLAESQALSSRIAAVNEIAAAINHSLNLDEILRVVGKQAKWLLDFEHCSICLHSNDGSWRIVTVFGTPVELDAYAITDISPIGRALRTRQPQLIHEGSTTAFLSPYPSQLIIPLESDRIVLGTINFATTPVRSYTQEDLRIGYLLAVQLSAAIRNAERFQELNRLYAQLELEKRKSDQLLLNTLPVDIADELKQTGKVNPVYYESASVLFTDFKNFTKLAEQLTPQELIDELDYCFSYFDHIIEKHNLEKLKTIGDSYMCAGGIPKPNETHAIDAVLAALEIQSFMQQRKEEKAKNNQPYWEVRIGIHSGPLVAGVIGKKKFAYDVWGDTVNTASRMESSGVPGRINISKSTFELIKDFFACEYRGELAAKNKGNIDMYLVTGIVKDLSLHAKGLSPNDKFNQLYLEILAGESDSIEPKRVLGKNQGRLIY